MPGANNVASAKTVGTSTKAAAEAIAFSFNTAIKYICDNIKTEAFAKGLDKKIDSFCKSTQKSITKLFGAFTFSSKMLKEAEKSDRAASIIQGFTSKLASIQVPKDLDKTMKSIADSVNAAKAILECIADIAKQSLLVSLLIVPALLGLVEMKLFIKAISWLATSISKMEIDEDKIKAILSMRDMIKAIMQIALISALFILIAPFAIVGLLAMLTFILAVKLLSMVLNLIKISEDSIDSVLSLEKMVKAILKVAMISALFILIAPFAILGLVGMILFVAALGLMGLLLKIVAPLFSEMKDEVKKILKIVTYLLLAAMVVCLFLIIAPFLLKAMFVALMFVIGLIPLAIFLKIAVEIFEEIKWGDMLKLLAMIAITLVIAFMLVIIGELGNATSIAGIILFGIALLTLTIGAVIATFMSKIVDYSDIIKLLVIVVLMLAISFMIVMISKLGDQISWSGMGWFGLALLAIMGVVIGLGVLMATGFGAAALALGLVALALIAGSVGLMLLTALMAVQLSKLGDKIDTKGIDLVGAALSKLTEMLIGIGAASFFVLPFLALASVVVLTICAAVVPMLLMTALLSTFDEKVDYSAKADALFGVFDTVIQKVDSFGIIGLASAMVKMAELSAIALALSFMAMTIGEIAKLNIPIDWNDKGKPIAFRQMTDADFTMACTNVEKVLTTVVNAASNEEVTKLTSDGLYKAMWNLQSLRYIAWQLSFMTMTVANIAKLSIADEWNDDGKPIHFRQMNDTDFELATSGATKIMTCLVDIVKSINTKDFEDAASRAEDIFDDIEEIVDPIGKIIDMVVNLASLQIPEEWDEEGKIIKFRHLNNDDFTKASTGIETILTGFCGAIEKIGTKAIEDAADRVEDIFDDIQECVDPIAGIVDMVLNLAQNGRIADQWDEEGKAIHWRELTDTDYTNASDSVVTIVTNFMKIFTDPKMLTIVSGKEAMKSVAEVFSSIQTTISPIKGIVEVVQAFAGGRFPTKFNSKGEGTDWVSVSELCDKNGTLSEKGKQIQNSITSLITLTFDAIKNAKLTQESITENANLVSQLGRATKPLGNMISYYDKLDDKKMQNVKEFTAQNIKWLDKVNAIDVEKVKTTANLFEQMTDFSKSIAGNFDKLADSINEKLMTVLQELKEILEKASDEIKEHHEKNPGGSDYPSTYGYGASKDKDFAKAPGKDEQDKDKKIDLSETNRRIGEVTSAINKLYNEISSSSSYFSR